MSLVIKILSFLIFINLFSKAQSRLVLNLLLDKTEYLVAEQIPVGIEVTNVSNNQIVDLILPLNGVGCRFKLFDQYGNEIDDNGFSITGDWAKYTVMPGGQLFGIENIVDMFGDFISLATTFKKLEKGRYTLFAYYDGSYYNNKFDTCSTHITFSIIEPSGEEANAFKMYYDIIWEARGGGTIKSTEELVTKLHDFEKKYPASIYRPMVIVILNAKYSCAIHNEEKANEMLAELIRLFPDFTVTIEQGIIKYSLSKISEMTEKKLFIAKLRKVLRSEIGKRVLDQISKFEKIE